MEKTVQLNFVRTTATIMENVKMVFANVLMDIKESFARRKHVQKTV